MTSEKLPQCMPSCHATTLALCSQATTEQVNEAITAALKERATWSTLPFSDRASVFLKAADLISGKYRYEMLAATILGQGKNAWQAEIDAVAETVDFLKFNSQYAEDLYSSQPVANSPGVWKYVVFLLFFLHSMELICFLSRVDYRPLEGFVYAFTPF